MKAPWLPVADIADRLDRLGLMAQALPGLLQALPGAARTRFAGPAITVTGSPAAGPDPDPHYAALDAAMLPGAVLLIAAGGYTDAALFGETRAAALLAKGCAGVVVDGAVHDAHAIAGIGLGLLCRGTHPARFIGRWRFAQHGETVTCCTVRVRPGDWIVADPDGAVVVPIEHLTEVMRR